MKLIFKYRFLLLFLFSSYSLNLKSQSVDELDSLYTALKRPLDDSARVETMLNICDIYYLTNRDSMIQISNRIYNFCEVALKKKNVKWKSYLWESKITAINNRAAGYEMIGDSQKAFKEYKKAYKLALKMNDKTNQGTILSNIAFMQYNLGQVDSSLNNFNKALARFETIKDTYMIVSTLYNMAHIYYELVDKEVAIKTYKKCLAIIEKSEHIFIELNVVNALTATMLDKADLKEAEKYNKRAFELVKITGVTDAMGNTLMNKAFIEEDKGNLDTALKYFKESDKLAMEIGDSYNSLQAKKNIGVVYRKLNNNALSKSYLQEAHRLAEEMQYPDYICETAQELYLLYKRNGPPALALTYYEQYILMRDSIQNEKNIKASISADVKNEFRRKSEIDSLKREDEKQLEKLDSEKKDALIKSQRTFQYALFGAIAFLFLIAAIIFKGYKNKQKANLIISKQKVEVEHQKEIVEEKNKEILDSINYAKRLQDAILPPLKLVKEFLPESFILYKPKDIVAGDFYFMEAVKGKVIFAAADCTGHGVPGAMVSVVCSNALNRAVKEFALINPAKILDKVKELVLDTFAKSESDVKDGMDISLCVLDTKNNNLDWAGANNPLWIVRSDKGNEDKSQATEELPFLIETKPDKQPIGKSAIDTPFTNHTIELRKGDFIYIFTDGYEDQFGGQKGKKFKSANMKKMLISISNLSAEEQRNEINLAFEGWRGDLEQVDDVCVIGVRI